MASRLFPLQLAIFLENAGYAVNIGGLRLTAVLEALETGNPFEAPPSDSPVLRQPEQPPTMDDIRLLPCEPAID